MSSCPTFKFILCLLIKIQRFKTYAYYVNEEMKWFSTDTAFDNIRVLNVPLV